MTLNRFFEDFIRDYLQIFFKYQIVNNLSDTSYLFYPGVTRFMAIIRNVIIANIIIILRLFFNGLIYHNNCKKGLRFLKDFYLCSNNMHRL